MKESLHVIRPGSLRYGDDDSIARRVRNRGHSPSIDLIDDAQSRVSATLLPAVRPAEFA